MAAALVVTGCGRTGDAAIIAATLSADELDDTTGDKVYFTRTP